MTSPKWGESALYRPRKRGHTNNGGGGTEGPEKTTGRTAGPAKGHGLINDDLKT